MHWACPDSGDAGRAIPAGKLKESNLGATQALSLQYQTSNAKSEVTASPAEPKTVATLRRAG